MSETKSRLLLVGTDRNLMHQLSDVLSGEYLTVQSSSFEDALSEILLGEFEMVITETRLPDLSGMDLLSVVNRLRPGTPVMVIDDDLSAKAAVAAMRLGACDYLHKPVNLQLMLMQINKQIMAARQRASQQPSPTTPETDQEALVLQPPPNGNLADSLRPRPRQPSPGVRPATLLLNREQFQKINDELATALAHIRAHFVGLIDAEGNLAGASGTLEDYDLVLLTRALSIDHTSTDTLARMLDENQFQAVYLEGKNSGVYIVELRDPYVLSLAVICSTEVKPGMVWLYTKRAADSISQFLSTSSANDDPNSTLNMEPLSSTTS
jgi:FixJ family two-component response regulator/predicted regulator of Ras-like GTPase activity (Roadblock/LC7/MglB family)